MPMSPTSEVSPCERIEKEISKPVEQIISNKIICPSVSHWASQVILLEERNWTTHFAMEYRGVNNVTHMDYLPMPDIRDIQVKLHGTTISQC